MSNNSVGRHEQYSVERQKYEDELIRIIQASESEAIMLRVMGSLAFHVHCPAYGYLQAAMGHDYADIDFVADSRDRTATRNIFVKLGYLENKEVTVVSEGTRMIFDNPELAIHVDVFFDKFDFCHEISLKDGRLEVDSPTIPLAEMLLQKTQIVKINEKDIVDTIMLLLEHPLADHDNDAINIQLVAELCAGDWGLWRTTTMNLTKVRQLVSGYSQLTDDQKAHIIAQVDVALQRINDEPKPLAWRLRDRVGDRVKWYKDVDEV